MSTTIDELQIEIEASSSDAASAIDKLSTSLGRLKGAVKGGSGLTTTKKQLEAFSTAVANLTLPGTKIAELVTSLKPLEDIGKSNLGAALNQLKKIPEVTAALESADMGKFAAQINEVVRAVKPLADEMEKVNLGFSRLPANIQRAINANAKLTQSNKTTAFGFNMLAAKAAIVYTSTKRVASVISDWIHESTTYVESLNLFTASMGKFAEEAQKYAEHVGNVMGIDPAEWMRNQGVFMTLATGFGVAADNAALMSKNLTQLGYDLGSFFNIPFAETMQKLQSGISGELEPLRRLGYDLSQAKLKQIAFNLGIEKSITDMTQAEKAQLRYRAILTQVTVSHGDMARTINAPANQLRVLSAQATQAARALGNIFIPALNAILPYAIAFLQVVRKIANEVANLFGFELPEIDYSGIDSLASSAGDASDEIDDATANVKKLKDAVTGIDELNILNFDSGSDGLSDIKDIFADIKLPEYDFLGDALEIRASAIAEKMEKPFREVLKLVGGIGVGIAAWKVTKWIAKFIELIAGKKLSDNLKALIGNAKALKTGVGITLAVTGIALEFDAFREIGKGNGDALNYIKAALGAALSVGGSLLVFGTGPLGWTIGIGLAITAAIVGFTIGNQEAIKGMVQNAFYGYKEGAISITLLSEQFALLMDDVIMVNQPIIDAGKVISGAGDLADTAAGKIYEISRAIELGGFTAKEKIPELQEEFTKLRDGTSEILEETYNNIVRAVSGSLYKALEDAGIYVPELLGVLAKVKGEVDVTFTDITKSFNEAQKAFEKDGDANKYADAIFNLTEKMQGLVGKTDPVKEAFSGVSDTLKGINWEDETAKNNAFELIKGSAIKAKESAQNAYDEIKNNVDTMRGWSTDTKFQEALDKIMSGAQTTLNTQNTNIQKEITAIYDTIQRDLIGKLPEVEAAAQKKWSEMNWFEKKIDGSKTEAGYVAKAMRNFYNDYIVPVSGGIDKSFKDLGVEGSAWANAAMREIFDALFEVTPTYNDLYGSSSRYSFKTDLETAVSGVMSGVGKSAIDGYAKGISDNGYVSTAALRDMVTDGSKAAAAAQESHSPSQLYYRHGLNAVQGYANAFKDNAYIAANAASNMATSVSDAIAKGANITAASGAFTTMFNAILKKLDAFSDKFRNSINSLLSGMATSMNGISMTTDGKIRFAEMPKINIPMLADGAVIPPRRPFAAILGDQQHGRNIETPEGVMRQVVREESGGGMNEDQFNRMMAALYAIVEKPFEASVEVDGTALARMTNKGNHDLGQPIMGRG